MFIPWCLATFVLLFGSIECGITSQWYTCDCEFQEWEAWSTCDSECNGKRRRSRRVSLDEDCVYDFNTCATTDMGWDYSRCNTFCYNGGTSDSYSCSCVTGFYGDCCGFRNNLSNIQCLFHISCCLNFTS